MSRRRQRRLLNTRCEDKGMTVIEGEPESPAAQAFLKLAKELLENAQDTAEEEVW